VGEHLRMNPSSRRLTFVVGTSLLTASLATGCKKSEPTVNPGPEPVHVNEGPAPEEAAPEETTDAPAEDAPAEEDPNANPPE
jgi:hypothetical protein